MPEINAVDTLDSVGAVPVPAAMSSIGFRSQQHSGDDAFNSFDDVPLSSSSVPGA